MSINLKLYGTFTFFFVAFSPLSKAAIKNQIEAYYPIYDGQFLESNITKYINEDAEIVYEVQYDPYGNIIKEKIKEGEEKPANFGFSTKYHDEKTDLIYFGYRHYFPKLGRWISKDPLNEWGSRRNLYAYVNNRPTHFIDYLGLKEYKYHAAICKRPLSSTDGSPYVADTHVDLRSEPYTDPITGVTYPGGVISVPVPEWIRTTIENIINDKAGHHDVGFIEEHDGEMNKIDDMGFFAVDIDAAGKGALLELVADAAATLIPFGRYIIPDSWQNAGWVDGEVYMPSKKPPGPCTNKKELTKSEFDKAMRLADDKLKEKPCPYHLLKGNCQHFASGFIGLLPF